MRAIIVHHVLVHVCVCVYVCECVRARACECFAAETEKYSKKGLGMDDDFDFGSMGAGGEGRDDEMLPADDDASVSCVRKRDFGLEKNFLSSGFRRSFPKCTKLTIMHAHIQPYTHTYRRSGPIWTMLMAMLVIMRPRLKSCLTPPTTHEQLEVEEAA